jgi:hypothetical protein
MLSPHEIVLVKHKIQSRKNDIVWINKDLESLYARQRQQVRVENETILNEVKDLNKTYCKEEKQKIRNRVNPLYLAIRVQFFEIARDIEKLLQKKMSLLNEVAEFDLLLDSN